MVLHTAIITDSATSLLFIHNSRFVVVLRGVSFWFDSKCEHEIIYMCKASGVASRIPQHAHISIHLSEPSLLFLTNCSQPHSNFPASDSCTLALLSRFAANVKTTPND